MGNRCEFGPGGAIATVSHGQRENRWMQDVNHQVSKALVAQNTKHTLFVLEDFSGVRNATETVKLYMAKTQYIRL